MLWYCKKIILCLVLFRIIMNFRLYNMQRSFPCTILVFSKELWDKWYINWVLNAKLNFGAFANLQWVSFSCPKLNILPYISKFFFFNLYEHHTKINSNLYTFEKKNRNWFERTWYDIERNMLPNPSFCGQKLVCTIISSDIQSLHYKVRIHSSGSTIISEWSIHRIQWSHSNVYALFNYPLSRFHDLV